ncbi:MAG: hypothetical protein C0515_02485 [Novosphingobium sp.]|nr:hypothetical protein [Novosphingobium sp.]
MIVPRLVLGTARIAGGASESAAVALVRTAFDAGIGAVDTAPSYGLGTAEQVVGRALAGHPQVAVTTKLGSHRPSHPMLRTWARRIKRLVSAPGEPEASVPPAWIAAPVGNDFSAPSMARSLEVSLNKLGRIDALLLHDISAQEVTPALLGDLAGLAQGRNSGYASYARWDVQLDQCFPQDSLAQCAPDPGWLLGTVPVPSGRPLRLHSIAKTGLALAATDPAFAKGLHEAAGLIEADPLTAQIAAIYALAAARVPQAHLLFTSSHPARLSALIKALQQVDEQHTAATIAACFPAQAG